MGAQQRSEIRGRRSANSQFDIGYLLFALGALLYAPCPPATFAGNVARRGSRRPSFLAPRSRNPGHF